MSDTLTMLAIATARHLEARGWAVAMFNPPDLFGADPRRVMEAMEDAAIRVIAEAESDNARDDL